MFKILFFVGCIFFCSVINAGTLETTNVSLTDKIESILNDTKEGNDKEAMETVGEIEKIEEEVEEVVEEIKKVDVGIFLPCFAINDEEKNSTTPDLEEQIEESDEETGSVYEMFAKNTATKNKMRYISISSNEYQTYYIDKKDYKKVYQYIKNIFDKVNNNFKYTNLFDVDYSDNFCDNVTNFIKDDNNIDVRDYIISGAFKNTRNVLNSEIEIIDKYNLKLKLFLWNTDKSEIIDGKYFIFNIKDKMDDVLADRISDFLLINIDREENGIFDSKILYVSETGSPKNRMKQIVISDLDGNKKVTITKGKSVKLTPIFSKNNKEEIFYNENIDGVFWVVKHNLLSGIKHIITTKNLTMTTSPAFHPTENKILVSGTENNGNTNLYLFDLDKNTHKKLTNSNAISTSASFSPDGSKVVYVSDKSGVKKLYIRDIVNGKEYLLTKEHGNYDKPAWSPDGKTIAFIRIELNDFSLGLIDVNGENERYLIKNFLIEGLRWAVNSRFLIYTKQIDVFGSMSIPKIYLFDLKTSKEIQLPLPIKEGASDIDIMLN
jgi:TolB protein